VLVMRTSEYGESNAYALEDLKLAAGNPVKEKDKRGVVIRNKARLVAQGYTQEEGINYDKVFAPVARIEAIRLFLAYASFMGLIVYQMDVNSAFLYGTIEEEVEKALYGLHQAPKAWYETLSTYLIENGFRRGTIDKTLFIKKDKGDILLVQVYVDDIIFGSIKKSLCDKFEGLMHKRFQMSSMGELTFFLGLQVQQKEEGIFISQDKYVAEILKKFDFATVKTASTPMEPNKALVKDEEADSVDVHLYISMIGSLMYLTASRPDITFVVCACARFQVTPKTSHLHVVKRIFRYLKGQPKLSLWYPRDSSFDLEAFLDSDYAGASLDRKSTTGDTKIYIDNESTICIVKNLVFYSKTKHIEIRHHFIRDSYEKRLIQGRLMVYKCSRLYTSAIWIEVRRLKMLFGPVLRVKHGKKLVSAARLALCCWAKVSTVRHRVNQLNSSIMVDLAFVKQHNMVAYLEKTEENVDFHQILDFLTSSLINFALTVSPTIYASYIEQFWNTACLKTINSEKQIHANVDGKAVVVSESSVRRDLHLNDEDGTACLTTNEIFENLALMGYEPASDKLTFYKGLFSPQWKYLIHTILHCLSSKSTSWDQFSTNLASAIICLAKGQKFNFSKLIFDGMLRNLDPKKFLMYPRFLQLFLNIQLPNLVIPFNDIHETPKLTKKVFTNIRKPGKGFLGRVTPLFQNMLVPPVVVGEGSKKPPEPQPIPSTAPPEVLSQVTTAIASQPPKDTNTYRRTKRGRNIKVPQSGGSLNKVGDEAINEEMFDSVKRAATTSSSLEVEQASGNINKTQFTTTLNEPFFLELGSGGHTLGSGEDSMEHQIELTDNVPNTPYDSPLIGVNTPGSDEGSLELNELMDLVTKLSHRVFDLEKVKTAQAKEIAGLKRRSLGKKDVSKQGRKHLKTHIQFGEDAFDDIDDLKFSILKKQLILGVSTASVPETISTTAPRTPTTTTTVFDDEDVTMDMAQTLIKMKEEKAKDK
ncbi:putative ribonuclease H-like domain-containing protein, partial [Tanacetum coccineum]